MPSPLARILLAVGVYPAERRLDIERGQEAIAVRTSDDVPPDLARPVRLQLVQVELCQIDPLALAGLASDNRYITLPHGNRDCVDA